MTFRAINSTGDGYLPGSSAVSVTQPTSAVDIKMVLQDSRTDFYYKLHTDSTWSTAGGFDAGNALSSYGMIGIDGHVGYAGGIDSIQLTASTVPEPTTLALLTTGLLALLAYAWRKRR